MIVYKPSDRVRVKFGPVTITVSPLAPHERIQVANKAVRGVDAGMNGIAPLAYETLRVAVKEVDAPGFEFPDGSPITLERGEDGLITDEGLAVLLQICDSAKLVSWAVQLAAKGVGDWGFEDVEVVNPFPEKKRAENSSTQA